ncbi:MAG: hypothetical protein MMC23_001851 [Stictis urceolatum]|nr:hypothetical protein [Stictis urceolata]
MPSLQTPDRPCTSTNPHTADPILQSFLGQTFDPTAYLNSHLPPLAIPTTNQPIIPAKSLSITDLSSRTQTHVAQLGAQTTRLSNTLTDLTDAILRSGPRLAYSVELLRGEANALADAMSDTLAEEIGSFIPGGLHAVLSSDSRARENGTMDDLPGGESPTDAAAASSDPPDLARLRMLHHVRSQLQSVIKTFDRALAWPLPPSSISIAQSLVSVSGPDSNSEDAQSLEERGQKAQRELRDSVTELLAPGGHSAGPEGVLAAEERIGQLKMLVEVWRGTAEEKARAKFVENLEKLVLERRRVEEERGAMKGREEADREQDAADTKADAKKGGLFGGLRRLREEIYLE